MGFQFRKSTRIGPFRVNVSKSGVGWSVGGKGFRTGVSSRGRRYSTFSLPETGLSYTQADGKGCLVLVLMGLGAAAGLTWTCVL
jgi:hypothetical protein